MLYGVRCYGDLVAVTRTGDSSVDEIIGNLNGEVANPNNLLGGRERRRPQKPEARHAKQPRGARPSAQSGDELGAGLPGAGRP